MVIMVHEATEVCKNGVIALPVHMGLVHGRVEKNSSPRPGVRNGELILPSGARIPWIPASQIGW